VKGLTYELKIFFIIMQQLRMRCGIPLERPVVADETASWTVECLLFEMDLKCLHQLGFVG
jgi:hypothetical protein